MTDPHLRDDQSGGPAATGGPAGPGAWSAPRIFCFACGESIDARAELCPRCGVRQPTRPGAIGAMPVAGVEKIAAGLLAIFLGSLGVHRFYLGDIAIGILYAVFSWTGIPTIVGIIEGIVYLTKSDEAWAREHPVGKGGLRSVAIGCGVIAVVGTVAFIAFFALFLAAGMGDMRSGASGSY